METVPVLAVLLSLGIGIWLIWDSIQFYTCQLRQESYIYLIEGTKPTYCAALYGAAPAGAIMIILGIALALPLSSDTFRSILLYVVGPFFLAGYVLVFWQPKRLRPKWLIWIEEYNYDIRSLLAEEARGSSNWMQLIRSETDLRNWVKAVREKHNEDQPLESFAEVLKRFREKDSR